MTEIPPKDQNCLVIGVWELDMIWSLEFGGLEFENEEQLRYIFLKQLRRYKSAEFKNRSQGVHHAGKTAGTV